MVLMAAQQFCGINSIIVYGVSLLSTLLTTSSKLLNVIVAIVNLVVTIAFSPLIDRLGRKTCLIASVTGMGLSSLLLAIGIAKGVNILSATMVLTFVGFFGLGLGPIPFILSSELVGPEAVGVTQSLALAASWISTFVVTQFFPLVNEKLGKGKVYYIFFAFAMGTALFVSIVRAVRSWVQANGDTDCLVRPGDQGQEGCR
jgi:MFS family permease